MEEFSIEFHGPTDRAFPRPYPASQDVPDWFKRMPAETSIEAGGRQWLTLKRCPPFLDALTAGYLIPLADEVRFTMENDGLTFTSTSPLIRTHEREQLPKELATRPVVKFANPWIVKTPPGWSCLFVQPMNRFELPFQILSGIVETDTYYQEISFPAICLLRPGQSAVLKKGTPIMQVVPFRRDGWKASFHSPDKARWTQAVAELRAASGAYKQFHWKRKAYE